MNRITVFHYHLLPGGVTNVILLGATALIRHFRDIQLLRIVCGKEENTETIEAKIKKEITAAGLGSGAFRFEICVEPDLYYREFDSPLNPENISTMAERLIKRFGDSFWWIHNYQLGKNPLFTAAVIEISNSRPEQKMLLHIHDFPECARYDNLEKLYRAGVKNPYPVSDSTAYCLINSRDAELLKNTGIPENSIFLLNDPVEDTVLSDGKPRQAEAVKKSFYEYFINRFPAVNPDAKMVFYPVRTIRRKNVLEAGLLAAVSEHPFNLVVSLPGVSAQEKKYSDTCEQCFADGLIPGVWGSGTVESPKVPSFYGMFEICDMIISSSVQEGFGYLFINSVRSGIPLVARDLDILNGIRQVFPEDKTGFYDRLTVPLERSEAEYVKQRYLDKLKILSDYITVEALEIIREKANMLAGGNEIDFSFLTVELQTDILKKTGGSETFRSEILNLNRPLMQRIYVLLDSGRYSPQINTDTFSIKAHAATVETIINRLYSSEYHHPKTQENIQQKLLDSFAEPEYMRLLYDY